MTGKHSRLEVLRELGQVVAELRDKREEIRADGNAVPPPLDERIEVLQTCYEFVVERWPA